MPRRPIKKHLFTQEIYLEGSLPAQSKILVSDAAIEPQTSKSEGNDPAVVLAGKVTLSVISSDACRGKSFY